MIAAWRMWIAVGVCSELVREKKANLVAVLPSLTLNFYNTIYSS
jgi:hypothetical protein